MPSLESNQSIRDLLLLFQGERFGFAAVTRKDMFSMAELYDVLGLFKEGRLKTELRVADVATMPISVTRDATIRDSISLMLERRVRRLFIQGTGSFVSDREIISYLFSPRKLQETKDNQATMLSGKVIEARPVEALRIEADLPLAEAAQLVTQTQGGTLTCRNGIASTWDIIMKPFASGDLSLG